MPNPKSEAYLQPILESITPTSMSFRLYGWTGSWRISYSEYPYDENVPETYTAEAEGTQTITITGLQPAKGWEFTACKDRGTRTDLACGSYSFQIGITELLYTPSIDALAAPTVMPDGLQLSVSWTAPAASTPITGYDVQYRAGNSGFWTSHVHTGTGTSATITGLTVCTSYQVQIRAIDTYGSGSWSPPAMAAIAGNGTPCSGDLKQGLEDTLAEVARNMMGGTVDVIGKRLSMGFGSAPAALAPDSLLLEPERLRRGDFELALNAGANSRKRWTLWGAGHYANFEEDSGSLQHDGDVRSAYLGMDMHTNDGRVLGLAISFSEGDADHHAEPGYGGLGADRGRLETDMLAAHPYFRAALGDDTQVWALAGIGRGDARYRLTDGNMEESDLEMHMGALGMRWKLHASDGLEWALRGDASMSRMETDSGTQLVDDLKADVHQIRAGLEFSGVQRPGKVSPFGAVAARYDGGDGMEGAGMDVEGGVRYASADGRARTEARGRWLTAHSESGYDQWSMSVSTQVLPDADGRGLSLRLEPRLGMPTGGDSPMWERGRSWEMEGNRSSARGLSLDAELGWGVWSPNLGGVLVWFGELERADAIASRVRLGLRFARYRAGAEELVVELFGEHGSREGPDGSSLGIDFRWIY